jgi:hypothetical protein
MRLGSMSICLNNNGKVPLPIEPYPIISIIPVILQCFVCVAVLAELILRAECFCLSQLSPRFSCRRSTVWDMYHHLLLIAQDVGFLCIAAGIFYRFNSSFATGRDWLGAAGCRLSFLCVIIVAPFTIFFFFFAFSARSVCVFLPLTLSVCGRSVACSCRQ